MNNLQKRKTLIRKLFKEVAKETVGAKNLKKIKLLILSKRLGRGTSYCGYRYRYIWQNNRREKKEYIRIGLNLRALEDRVREGYNSSYYNGRPDRLNRYIKKNRHNALRFVLYHEARHAFQKLNNVYRDNLAQKEYDADTWALAHIKTRPQDQTRPAQIKRQKPLKISERLQSIFAHNYKQGYSTSKIAKIYGIKDPRSVRYYLTKAGINLRRT